MLMFTIGNPDRTGAGGSILRLIPGGSFFDQLENQRAGSHLKNWVQSVATRYNRQTGQRITPEGIVYCVDFDASFTNYQPEDLINENACAQPYGPEFTLVNDYIDNGARTWDPWFDVAGTDRKNLELMHYIDPDGDMVVTDPTDDDYAVYDLLPPTYCEYPSPGQQNYDRATGTWSLANGYQSLPRRDDIAIFERCTDPPGTGSRFKREDTGVSLLASTNYTRSHPRDLAKRQSSSGSFLDPNVYKFLGCYETGYSDEDGDPCAAEDAPCGNAATEIPTTNGADPTLDPLPVSTESGFSTGPVTVEPSTTAASSSANVTSFSSSFPSSTTSVNITSVGGSDTPVATSFVSCSTQFQDPDQGITQDYCVCSGSTFAFKTNTEVTPAISCAYTSPLPTTTTSIPPPDTPSSVVPSSTSSSAAPTPTVKFALYSDNNCEENYANVTIDSLNTCQVPQPNTGWTSMLLLSSQGIGENAQGVVYALNSCDPDDLSFGVAAAAAGCIYGFGLPLTDPGCDTHDCFVAAGIEWTDWDD
jgi:hypothetical protein